MENKRNNRNLTSPTTTTASPTVGPAFGNPLKIVRNLSLKRIRGSSTMQEKVCLQLDQTAAASRIITMHDHAPGHCSYY